ncbi:reversion-inducing cysteine-rich protein with Kazal motifs [Hetaerina americana]|uniref:reversion-inducing cysteine-rich protein with Kazal motifs n=1 Tax=Hetaerina americana TaxID=62018 RepID=UPI003A7F2E7D
MATGGVEHALQPPLLLLLVPLLLFGSHSAAQEPHCCSIASGSCRSACKQVSLVDIATDTEVREAKLTQLRNFCSLELTTFWKCVNATWEEVRRGEGWCGRSCCPLPQSEACRMACVSAGSRKDLDASCRESDEIAFFSCLDRQEAGERCCAHAQTPDCARACRGVFRVGVTVSRAAVIATCTNRSPKVLQCVKNYTRLTPATNPEKNLHCCNEAANPDCQEACRIVLRTQTTQESVVEGLVAGGCGPPHPIDKMWQCFLQGAESGGIGGSRPSGGDSSDNSGYSTTASRIEIVGMDSAKLQCCSRAVNPSCRRLCAVTYLNEWARGWDTFHQECLQSVSEVNLAHCIDDVDKPCELGCEGLNYCTNFNNRPTELFRSCAPDTDMAARLLVALWEDTGRLFLPPGLGIPGIPLRNTSAIVQLSSAGASSRSPFTLSCSPLTWKAVACALQLNPCHPTSHDSRICIEDCLELVSQCTDWSQMPKDHHLTPTSICARLSPPSLQISGCISLWPFLSPSKRPYYEGVTIEPLPPTPLQHQQQSKQTQNDEQQGLTHMVDLVTAPCKINPCGISEVCIVNRSCIPGKPCLPYSCVPGCRLGELSTYVVPKGSFMQIPVSANMKDRGCYKVCQCSSASSLISSGGMTSVTTNGVHEVAIVGQCLPLPCFPLDSCWLGSRKIEHGSWFYVDCNLCSCYAGEKTCSKRQCGEMWGVEASRSMSLKGLLDDADSRKEADLISLPCNCPARYSPTCGRNGKTYPSSCLAKCAGLGDGDFEYGACMSIDPCEGNTCGVDEVCVPHRRVCLSLLHRPCPQYECVGKQKKCSEMEYEPVCDTDGEEHPNSCFLTQYGKTLAYRGSCISNCQMHGEVCGINGDTYNSECAAIADRITVDYYGPCVSIGRITEGIGDYIRRNHWKKVCDGAVKCPLLPRDDCLASIPPGSCCPVCAGALRLLFSQKQVERGMYATVNVEPKLRDHIMTVESMLRHLERHIQVAECSVYGMLSIEMDIYVLVRARDGVNPNDGMIHSPSELQMEACIAEAEKLARMVQGRSPRILSEVPLSTLTTASVVHLVASSSSTLSIDYHHIFVAVIISNIFRHFQVVR